eukprot:COSAG05_NODE_1130_length_5776_cov_3.102695_2_plen_946_part_00
MEEDASLLSWWRGFPLLAHERGVATPEEAGEIPPELLRVLWSSDPVHPSLHPEIDDSDRDECKSSEVATCASRERYKFNGSFASLRQPEPEPEPELVVAVEQAERDDGNRLDENVVVVAAHHAEDDASPAAASFTPLVSGRSFEDYLDSGAYQLGRGEIARAVQSFNCCRALSPTDPRAPYNLACCYALMAPEPRVQAAVRWLSVPHTRPLLFLPPSPSLFLSVLRATHAPVLALVSQLWDSGLAVMEPWYWHVADTALRCGLPDAAATLRADDDLAALRQHESFQKLLRQVEAATVRLGGEGLAALGSSGMHLGFLATLDSSPEKWFANRAQVKAKAKAERIARQQAKALNQHTQQTNHNVKDADGKQEQKNAGNEHRGEEKRADCYQVGADAAAADEQEELAGEQALRSSSGFADLLAREAAADPLATGVAGCDDGHELGAGDWQRRRRRCQRRRRVKLDTVVDSNTDSDSADDTRMSTISRETDKSGMQEFIAKKQRLVQSYRRLGERPKSADAALMVGSGPGEQSGIVQRHRAKHGGQTPQQKKRPFSAAALLSQFVDAENEQAFDLMNAALLSPGDKRNSYSHTHGVHRGGRRLDNQNGDDAKELVDNSTNVAPRRSVDALELGALLTFWQNDRAQLLSIFSALPAALRPSLARQTLRQVAVGLEISPQTADYACELAGLPPQPQPSSSHMKEEGQEEDPVPRDQFLGRFSRLAEAWASHLAQHSVSGKTGKVEKSKDTDTERHQNDNESDNNVPSAEAAAAAMAAVAASGPPGELWLSAVLGASSPRRAASPHATGGGRQASSARLGAKVATDLTGWERRCYGAMSAVGLSSLAESDECQHGSEDAREVHSWTVEQLGDWLLVMDIGLTHEQGDGELPTDRLCELLLLTPIEICQRLGLEWGTETRPTLRQRKLLAKAVDFLRELAARQQRTRLLWLAT